MVAHEISCLRGVDIAVAVDIRSGELTVESVRGWHVVGAVTGREGAHRHTRLEWVEQIASQKGGEWWLRWVVGGRRRRRRRHIARVGASVSDLEAPLLIEDALRELKDVVHLVERSEDAGWITAHLMRIQGFR